MNKLKATSIIFLTVFSPLIMADTSTAPQACDQSVKFSITSNAEGDKLYRMETSSGFDENAGEMAAYATVSTYMLQQMEALKQSSGQCAYLPQVKKFIKQNLSCNDVKVAQSVNNNICDAASDFQKSGSSLSCCVHRYNQSYNEILSCGLDIDATKYEPLCQHWENNH